MSEIALSAGVRANLLSLQNTAKLMQMTQTNLATGKKVNSALDNPLNFFTSQNLNNRANSLNGLLDSMSNGIQTIQAANNGITSITSLVQQLQSVVAQARGDTSAGTVTPGAATVLTSTANNANGVNSNITLHVSGGTAVTINVDPGTTPATLTGVGGAAATAAGSFTISAANLNGGAAVTVNFALGDSLATIAGNINTALAAATGGAAGINADASSGQIVLTSATGNNVSLTDTTAGSLTQIGFTSGSSSTNGVVGSLMTNADIANAINTNSILASQVRASVDGTGHLSLQNLTTSAIAVDGVTAAAVTGVATDTISLAAGTGGALSGVRQSLLNTYNSLLTQINQTASDSGYNGINLLNADSMTVKFNENGTSSISIQMVDSSSNPFAINATNLGLSAATTTVFGSNSNLDSLTTTLSTALTTLQTQATAISSSLSVVQARQDFTKNMVNTLQTGADNLVLADPNQEGANLLALQTRQSLSTTALSMASQADQAVLRLFQ